MIKECEYCHNTFLARRNDAKFCSSKHRSLYYNQKPAFQKKIIEILNKNYKILKEKLDFISQEYGIDEFEESLEYIKFLGFNRNVYTNKISTDSYLIFDIRYSIDDELNVITFHFLDEELKLKRYIVV